MSQWQSTPYKEPELPKEQQSHYCCCFGAQPTIIPERYGVDPSKLPTIQGVLVRCEATVGQNPASKFSQVMVDADHPVRRPYWKEFGTLCPFSEKIGKPLRVFKPFHPPVDTGISEWYLIQGGKGNSAACMLMSNVEGPLRSDLATHSTDPRFNAKDSASYETMGDVLFVCDDNKTDLTLEDVAAMYHMVYFWVFEIFKDRQLWARPETDLTISLPVKNLADGSFGDMQPHHLVDDLLTPERFEEARRSWGNPNGVASMAFLDREFVRDMPFRAASGQLSLPENQVQESQDVHVVPDSQTIEDDGYESDIYNASDRGDAPIPDSTNAPASVYPDFLEPDEAVVENQSDDHNANMQPESLNEPEEMRISFDFQSTLSSDEEPEADDNGVAHPEYTVEGFKNDMYLIDPKLFLPFEPDDGISRSLQPVHHDDDLGAAYQEPPYEPPSYLGDLNKPQPSVPDTPTQHVESTAKNKGKGKAKAVGPESPIDPPSTRPHGLKEIQNRAAMVDNETMTTDNLKADGKYAGTRSVLQNERTEIIPFHMPAPSAPPPIQNQSEIQPLDNMNWTADVINEKRAKQRVAAARHQQFLTPSLPPRPPHLQMPVPSTNIQPQTQPPAQPMGNTRIFKIVPYECVVDQVVASRRHGNGAYLQYRVKWVGEQMQDRSWYNAGTLKHAAEQLSLYHRRNPRAPGPPMRLAQWLEASRAGRVAEDHSDDQRPAAAKDDSAMPNK